MQNMRLKDSQDVEGMSNEEDGGVVPKKERRNASLMSKRIFDVVNNVIIPLSHTLESGRGYTSFIFSEEENISIVLRDVLMRDCPHVMKDRGLFLRIVGGIYDGVVVENEGRL
jgi:hypothetical protein